MPEPHINQDSEPGLGRGYEAPTVLWRAPRQGGLMRREAVTLEGVAYEATPRERPAQPFGQGDRVFHQKFGYGTIRAADNDKLTIAFDHTGEKKVMDSFVVPADQAG